MSDFPISIDQKEFTELILTIRERDLDTPLVCKLGGGVIRFASAVFPEQDSSRLFGHTFEREDEGIGPHFDVYGDYLDTNFPWVGVYNLKGSANVKAIPLPADLTSTYRKMFPERSDEAGEARRHFGAIALGNPKAKPIKFSLKPGVGMVLPQRVGGVEIVHDVIPVHPGKDEPVTGKYLKIIMPNLDSQAAMDALTGEFGYKPLDGLITEAVGGEIVATPVLGLTKINVAPHRPAPEPPRGGYRRGREDRFSRNRFTRRLD